MPGRLPGQDPSCAAVRSHTGNRDCRRGHSAVRQRDLRRGSSKTVTASTNERASRRRIRPPVFVRLAPAAASPAARNRRNRRGHRSGVSAAEHHREDRAANRTKAAQNGEPGLRDVGGALRSARRNAGTGTTPTRQLRVPVPVTSVLKSRRASVRTRRAIDQRSRHRIPGVPGLVADTSRSPGRSPHGCAVACRIGAGRVQCPPDLFCRRGASAALARWPAGTLS